MKVSVRNLNNEIVKEIVLPEAIFAYPYKEHLIHTAVVAVQAAQRRGTHKTKLRSEVSGSGRKPYRQKGTGRARAGSLRTPLWRTGGTVHGPRPRSHAKSLGGREKRNALKSALSRKLLEERILVVEDLNLESYRTPRLIQRLTGLGVEGRALLVDSFANRNLFLAARNNRLLKTVDPLAVNVYDIVDRGYVVVSEPALNRLVEVLGK